MQNNQEDKAKELQSEEQKKKKKRKFLILLLLLLLLFGGTSGAVIAIVSSGSNSSNTAQQEDLSTKFYAVIDPMIVTGEGVTHITGAERFFLDDLIASGGVKNTSIEVNLEFGQYFCYEYSFTNNGKKQINVTLDLNVEQVDNAYVTYAIADGAEQSAVDRLYSGVIVPQGAQSIKVYIRIVDVNQDANIKGNLSLTLTELGE